MNNFSNYELLVYVIGIIEMIYFFNKLMPSKNKKIIYIFIYIMILIILNNAIPEVNLDVILNSKYNNCVFLITLLNNILILSYPIIFRKGTFPEKLFLGSLYLYMLILLTTITSILYTNILHIPFVDVIIDKGYKRAILLTLIKIIHFIFIMILPKYNTLTRYIDNKSLYTRSMRLIFLQIILFTSIRYTVLYSTNEIDGLSIIVLFLFISQIIFIYNMEIFSQEMKNKFILVEELNYKKYEEHIIEMYQEMRAWRHDLRNHVNVVLGLLELDEKNKAIEYINEVESRTNKFESYIYTNNILIDSLLSNKVNTAKEKNINLNLKINIISEIKISNVDLCTLIGNLMDNAIEACEKVKGYKFINMVIISENNLLVIRVKNSSDGKLKKIKGKFITTKQESGHGFGLIQIDNIVKKFNGYINREYNENVFDTYIRIDYK